MLGDDQGRDLLAGQKFPAPILTAAAQGDEHIVAWQCVSGIC